MSIVLTELKNPETASPSYHPKMAHFIALLDEYGVWHNWTEETRTFLFLKDPLSKLKDSSQTMKISG